VCGVFFTNSLNEYKSKEISSSLLMRGPDKGTVLSESDYIVQFARLSIRDISGGDQPYFSQENSHIAAINGELYNEDFVKNRLKIHRNIIPSGDMQLLAEFLIQDIDNLRYIEGMFAGFIYNKFKKEIVLFRDPVGEKPLYFYITNGTITISSTIGAIIEHFDKDNFRLNIRTLFKGHHSPGETIFAEIKEVLPGHYLKFSLASHELRNVKYFKWPTRNIEDASNYNPRPQFTDYFLNAVKTTSISEVPICMLLSGGLDSAAILAALNTVKSTAIPAFTLKFENQTYDESALAQLSAKSLGSSHTIISITNREFATNISEVMDSLDSPILDPAYIPMYFLAKKIRNDYGFKVAITGDGGDELFRGYELYKIMKSVNFANSFPINIASIAAINIFNLLNVGSNRRNSLSFLLNRLCTVLENQNIPWNETALSPFAGTELFSLLAPPKIKSPITKSRRITQIDIDNYYHDEILPQVYLKKSDNGSMSNGLELRAPFLNKSMLNFAHTISGKNLGAKPHKWLLREYLLDQVPSKILNQPKRGFSVPLSGIISNIKKPTWKLEKINLNSNVCDSVWEKGCKGDANAARAGYGIMVLNSYFQRYV